MVSARAPASCRAFPYCRGARSIQPLRCRGQGDDRSSSGSDRSTQLVCFQADELFPPFELTKVATTTTTHVVTNQPRIAVVVAGGVSKPPPRSLSLSLSSFLGS
ncbi:hypothetical protein BDA96_05G020400 [Sorghum bicolor]|uniref:Uncharacterized protein n=1 Tax=Sorghum bicolor TaxID=4558 RepID=A0A921QUB0_SORBI|nr:hypothetical protein BDA96_05G020400 [Sorghum bicolor]